MKSIIKLLKQAGNLFLGVLGFLFYVATLLVWLSFFGLIPSDPPPTEEACTNNYMGSCF